MNLHSPQLPEKVADFAFYVIILLAAGFIWFAISNARTNDPRLVDPQMIAESSIMLFSV